MIKFIDLFSGTGGIRLGFEQALDQLSIKHKCVYSCEIDKKACLSYQLNFGENPYGDITKVEASSLPDFDFLLAGFPCQAFSHAGQRKGFEDTRGTLFFDVARILKEKQPKFFLLENVRGLISHDKGNTYKVIEKTLKELGYGVDFLLLNSSSFSVPQNRVRIYIFGVLNSAPKMTLSTNLGATDSHDFKNKINDFNNVKYIKDILDPIVDEKYICSSHFQKMINNAIPDLNEIHGYRLIDYRGGKSLHSWELGIKGKCSSKEIEFMNLLISNRRKKIFGTHKDGKSLSKEQIMTFYPYNDFDKITDSLILKGYLSKKDELYNPVCGNMSFEVFKFLDPESISITLTASDSNRLGVYHNNILRKITPRECARIQGYPESYILLDDDNAVYKQMGNGVSVPVIKAVALDFIENNISNLSIKRAI
ncbi:DNA cytosine methyltransferase [Citrobacter freundii]|uniref:DNA cytosine methyltransferase n=1 Tax=Citrobacter sp. Cb028 TaxID=2985024 RepID=UPI002577A00A|nr:DNA cytosine methyltransferase [Citrobacter sp. Cb028]EKW9287156.1 DNA cytosine methyltransferase [Citrobacter freundii]MDM3453201.1 DNA cytosine methyltransferase [Citrobacter sp. Cb028]